MEIRKNLHKKGRAKSDSSYARDINRLKKKILWHEEILLRRNNERKELKQECHQWKETCEVLADPKIRKSITKSLKEFAEGKGIPLDKL